MHMSPERDMNVVIVAAGQGPGTEKGFLASECWTGFKCTVQTLKVWVQGPTCGRPKNIWSVVGLRRLTVVLP